MISCLEKHSFMIILLCATSVLFTAGTTQAQPGGPADFRPPAVPLVAIDPYLSVWSKADRLTDDTTRHWTGREHPLVSLISNRRESVPDHGEGARGCAGFSPGQRAGLADAKHL